MLDALPVARLFNALVVVGAGISISGCGGRASSDSSAGGATSTGGTSTGGTSTGGTSTGGTSTGGMGGASTGGTTGGAGAAGASAGGAGGWSGSPETQWDCSAQFQQCQRLDVAVYILQEPCPVDPSRPRSPADCAVNEWFECIAADLNGARLAVNCECTPMAPDGPCSCVDPTGIEVPATCTNNVKVCACAHPSILIAK